jgi:Spy/CpxP family protein refolding chaperone
MRWHHVGVTALALLLLSGRTWLSAAEEPATRGHSRLDALAAKLNLTDDQKEKIKAIHADYDKKEDALRQQMGELRTQLHEALSKNLTESQRARVPEILKEERDKEFAKIAEELGLTPDQKQRVGKIRAEYDAKIHQLEEKKGQDHYAQLRHLRHEEFAAMRQELNDAQRAKAPGILREEFHQWRNPVTRAQHLAGIADKLELSPEQKEKMKTVLDEYRPKIEKLAGQFREDHQEERQAVEKVLTPEQRTKFEDLVKAHRGGGARQ